MTEPHAYHSVTFDKNRAPWREYMLLQMASIAHPNRDLQTITQAIIDRCDRCGRSLSMAELRFQQDQLLCLDCCTEPRNPH